MTVENSLWIFNYSERVFIFSLFDVKFFTSFLFVHNKTCQNTCSFSIHTTPVVEVMTSLFLLIMTITLWNVFASSFSSMNSLESIIFKSFLVSCSFESLLTFFLCLAVFRAWFRDEMLMIKLYLLNLNGICWWNSFKLVKFTKTQFTVSHFYTHTITHFHFFPRWQIILKNIFVR